ADTAIVPANFLGDVDGAGIESRRRPKSQAHVPTCSNRVAGKDCCARFLRQECQQQADWSLSYNRHDFVWRNSRLVYRFKAGIDRFDKRGLFEGHSVWYRDHSAADNPWHHTHILCESASVWLESGCDANLLVRRALGKQFTHAIEAIAAR